MYKVTFFLLLLSSFINAEDVPPLINRQIIYVYDPDWRPFEWQDEMSKTHFGIISDILNVISEKTNIKFIPIPTKSWSESIKLVKSKKAEMFSAVPFSKERARYVDFTKHNIYSYPAVIVSNIDTPITLEDTFKNHTIGIVKGNSLGEWIKNKYPKSKFVEFKDIQDGFNALESKDIDFFGINGVTALYYINILGFDEVKIYTKMDYMFNLKIAIIKEKSAQLLPIIDKALSEISQKELSDIYHKWTSIKIEKELDLRLLIIIFVVVIFIVLVFLFINKKLKSLVAEKTLQLQELNESLEQKVQDRTKELARINKNMQDSIKYASLIQNTLLPEQEGMNKCFKEHFVIWKPKDIVGGDIYFFNTLDKDRYLLFVIDCTGHGVSGAFITMLVRALQEQVLIELKEEDDYSPAKILEFFNISLKQLLKQEGSNSNVGIDAGIVLIDKRKNILKFSGANIPLYYVKNDKLDFLKANRYSVGYKQCKLDYKYEESELTLESGMKFYISTDGYIDQNGGGKGFPFGKKRFKNIILKYCEEPFHSKEEFFKKELASYQQDEDRNDDVTLIGFTF